jgi:hypothetical protein
MHFDADVFHTAAKHSKVQCKLDLKSCHLAIFSQRKKSPRTKLQSQIVLQHITLIFIFTKSILLQVVFKLQV